VRRRAHAPYQPEQRLECYTRQLRIAAFQIRQSHREKIMPIVKKELRLADAQQTRDEREDHLNTTIVSVAWRALIQVDAFCDLPNRYNASRAIVQS
jgi:hypothetical protein